jgi:hypothetical protein
MARRGGIAEQAGEGHLKAAVTQKHKQLDITTQRKCLTFVSVSSTLRVIVPGAAPAKKQLATGN